jgi:putative addiction module component (TIGR02574 family)
MDLGGAMKETLRIDSLSADERLELLERIWESLSERASDVPITDDQKTELDRRALSLQRDLKDGKPLGVPWDEVMRQLRARR